MTAETKVLANLRRITNPPEPDLSGPPKCPNIIVPKKQTQFIKGRNKSNYLSHKDLRVDTGIRESTKKNTYLKKQTQFLKHKNEHNALCNKNLRPIGHLVTWEKANPNKANFQPTFPSVGPARRQPRSSPVCVLGFTPPNTQ